VLVVLDVNLYMLWDFEWYQSITVPYFLCDLHAPLFFFPPSHHLSVYCLEYEQHIYNPQHWFLLFCCVCCANS